MGSWRGNSTASYSTGNGSIANWGRVRLEGDDDLTLGGTSVRTVGMGIEGRPNTRGLRRSSGMSRAEVQQATSDADVSERRERQVLTTLALLQTFHAHTCFQLSRFATLLEGGDGETVCVTPRDMLAFELGPLSAVDARYLEWLGEEYGGGARVVMKRGWKDLFGAMFGFG